MGFLLWIYLGTKTSRCKLHCLNHVSGSSLKLGLSWQWTLAKYFRVYCVSISLPLSMVQIKKVMFLSCADTIYDISQAQSHSFIWKMLLSKVTHCTSTRSTSIYSMFSDYIHDIMVVCMSYHLCCRKNTQSYNASLRIWRGLLCFLQDHSCE